jgi:DNA-binding transcriptional MocR family regulator
MTQPLADVSQEALLALEQRWSHEYDLVKANKLNLDLSRGKPGEDQLALSDAMEDVIGGNYRASDGTDTRNYGNLKGLPEARELGAQLLGVPSANVFAIGNSSLTLMHLVTSTALQAGLWSDERRWSNLESPKVLTPVPGYDRHFALCESLGIGMVNVAMGNDGPDVEQARQLAANDDSIKGIWCVPKYSNPTGCTYSDEVVQALAELPRDAAADDFVVLWDNAYAAHHLEFPGDELASVFAAAEAIGTSDHVVQFASTSKITFAGAGVAFVAASQSVLDGLESRMSFFTIGPDKVNQLRHARFLSGRLEEHMRAHAEILKPKFAIVQDTLATELGDLGIATWTHPRGGYFVSLDLQAGLAAQVVEMAREVGLTLTPAGATYPYGEDPNDNNVRIAPTFADIEELKIAMQTLTLCVKLASARQLMAHRNP